MHHMCICLSLTVEEETGSRGSWCLYLQQSIGKRQGPPWTAAEKRTADLCQKGSKRCHHPLLPLKLSTLHHTNSRSQSS
ncbi:hypothetical protein ATANTOWER_005555 [Ataeniobius toweri]|uniref:Uncharacterized protein n=1 Tax=Ataeniobius toweri TaxID=208326 RepID=A0ABU7A4H7_9TELE|nr:hypothetical protein [Ataeniobius toweri]